MEVFIESLACMRLIAQDQPHEYVNKLFTGLGSVRIMKNCDLGLENAALVLRPRVPFSRPRPQSFTIRTSLQPRSQCLSSYRPLERAKRDSGTGWSRATLTIENIREGSSVISSFVARCDRHIVRGVYQYLAFRLKFRIISVPTFT